MKFADIIMPAVSNRGLTRKETIVALLIVGSLLAFTAVKFVDIHNKCKDGRTRYDLERIRSSIAAYYGDHRSTYPTDNLSALVPIYIESIPHVHVGPHGQSNAVHINTDELGLGGWYYYNDPQDPRWGNVVVNLSTQDVTGKPWMEN